MEYSFFGRHLSRVFQTELMRPFGLLVVGVLELWPIRGDWLERASSRDSLQSVTLQ